MKKFLFLLSAGLFSCAVQNPCFSLELQNKGNVLVMTGRIKSGDEFAFREFMSDPANAQIKIIKLNSPGGQVIPARDIGRIIRSKNLTTVIDARTDNCASACTVLFASGVKRHYLNGQTIKDGVYGFKELTVGLGYHEGNNALSLATNKYSGQATADMIAAYYEFGVQKAKDIITLAPPDKLYRISAQTALDLGIATNLSAP